MTNTIEDAADFQAWQGQTLDKLHQLVLALDEYTIAVQNTTIEDWLTQELPEIPNVLVEMV